MKSCNRIDELLDEYIDGALPPEAAEDVSEHLAECGRCRAEEAVLRDIVERAGALSKEISPSRELWGDVVSQLENPRDSTVSERSRILSALWRYGLPVAAVLALVVVSSLMTRPGGEPTIETRGDELASARAEYEQAKSELMAALERENVSLRPETVDTIERNLAIIEGAVSELKLALNESPENPHLRRMLIATYKNEVNLLHQALRLADTT